ECLGVRELGNRIATILENASVRVYVRDRALAGCRVRKAGIVGDQTPTTRPNLDLPQVARAEPAELDPQDVRLRGALDLDGQADPCLPCAARIRPPGSHPTTPSFAESALASLYVATTRARSSTLIYDQYSRMRGRGLIFRTPNFAACTR